MAKYHISEDGKPRLCTAASAESCPVKGIDGQVASHGDFASDKDARAFAEQVLERHLGETATVSVSKKANSKKEAMTPTPETLPDMHELFKESPRSTVGVGRTYAQLNGIQRDRDAGLLDDAGARSRIASIVETLDEMAVWDRTAGTDAAIAYRDRLSRLAGDAKPFTPLAVDPAWGSVMKDIRVLGQKVGRSTDVGKLLYGLEAQLRGTPFNHEGYSEERMRGIAKELQLKTSRARSAEALKLARSLSEVLTDSDS